MSIPIYFFSYKTPVLGGVVTQLTSNINAMNNARVSKSFNQSRDVIRSWGNDARVLEKSLPNYFL